MTLNPLATAALVVLAFAQVVQAWVALTPSAEEVYFRVVQQFCKKDADMEFYVTCMARFTTGADMKKGPV